MRRATGKVNVASPLLGATHSREVRMSKPARALASLLVVAPVLAACAATDPTTSPLTRAARAPTTERAAVQRIHDADLGFFSVLDATDGLAVTIGLINPIAEWCATGTTVASPIRFQLVTTPAGDDQLLVTARDAPIVVYDYTGGTPGIDPCALVGRRVVATGTGSLSVAQNGPSGAAPAQYTGTINGTATLVGGGDAAVHAKERLRTGPDGVSLVSEVTLVPLHGR
jgi:hypothetical protein